MYPFMDRIAAGAIFSLSGLGRVAILRQVVRQATFDTWVRIYGRRVPRLIAGIVVRVATRIMIPIFLLPILAIAVLTLVVILVAIPVAVSTTVP
jgi:hypothetical protein